MIRLLFPLLIFIAGVALAIYPHLVLRRMNERDRAMVPASAEYLAWVMSAVVAIATAYLVVHVATTVAGQL